MNDLPRRILFFAALTALGMGPLVVQYLGGSYGDRDGRDGVEVGSVGSDREPSDDRSARASLETLTGCFAVRYQFTEDGQRDFFFDDGVEYMDVRAHGDGYVARNFLVYGDDPFLHWTQEWQPIGAGRWLLTVRSGDDSLRYRSEGVWRFNQWEGDAALAEKPTRDGLRSDYDQLVRRNVIQFTDRRWVQAEVNLKERADGTPVASEVGWITYTLRDSDELCAPAKDLAAASSTTP